MYIHDVYNTLNKPWLPYTREKLITNKTHGNIIGCEGKGCNMQHIGCCECGALSPNGQRRNYRSPELSNSRSALEISSRSASDPCPSVLCLCSSQEIRVISASQPGTTFHTNLLIYFWQLFGLTCAWSLRGFGLSFVYFETFVYILIFLVNNSIVSHYCFEIEL